MRSNREGQVSYRRGDSNRRGDMHSVKSRGGSLSRGGREERGERRELELNSVNYGFQVKSV